MLTLRRRSEAADWPFLLWALALTYFAALLAVLAAVSLIRTFVGPSSIVVGAPLQLLVDAQDVVRMVIGLAPAVLLLGIPLAVSLRRREGSFLARVKRGALGGIRQGCFAALVFHVTLGLLNLATLPQPFAVETLSAQMWLRLFVWLLSLPFAILCGACIGALLGAFAHWWSEIRREVACSGASHTPPPSGA